MNSIFTDIDLTKGTKQVKTPFVGFLIYSFIFIFQIVTSIVYFLILYWQHWTRLRLPLIWMDFGVFFLIDETHQITLKVL